MRAGALEAAFSPAVGGSLAALRFEGHHLLRPAPQDSADPLDMGSFPLLPYANRIAHGRFTLAQRTYQLPRNFGDHPHSIHGVGWQRPWSIDACDDDRLILSHRHEADAAWPWSYRAVQQAMLTPDAIDIHLSLINGSADPMPAGLGFHPYFLTDAGTRLSFDAASLWRATPDMLPLDAVAADALGDWRQPAPVAGASLIDNVYGGWDGAAIVHRGDGIRLTLTARGADWLHVFRPPDADFFCLEPVSHMPDAINRPGGMTMLAPGAAIELAMTIAVARNAGTAA